MECAWRGCDSVAAESGRGEVGMVGQVEKFRAELKMCLLSRAEVLEHREIHAVKTRAVKLCGSAAQWSVVGLADRGGHGRALESCRVDPLIYIVRTGSDALAGNQQGIAAVIGRSADHATHGPWL